MRDRGLDVTLKDVANEAGVSVGTVYRHFQSKDELVAALFAEQLDAEVQRARDTAEQGDAWAALVGYLHETMRLQAGNLGRCSRPCRPASPS